MLPLAAIPAEVFVGVIAAVASVAAAVVSGLLTRRNNAALKELEEKQAETNALISYRFEARKRLYSVCEPLLFQSTEQAIEASARIRGLAKAAKGGQLRADGSGWLDSSGNYFFMSTVFNLLAPLTSFSILQRRLTTIDLSLDTAVRAKYETLKLIFFSFKNDWNLAEWGGEGVALDYDRNRTDVGEPERDRLLREDPQRFAPQGLYRAMLYVVAEAFITSGHEPAPGAAERCITFGEFQQAWQGVESKRAKLNRPFGRFTRLAAETPMEPVFDPLVELFAGFHPLRKPVLWRVLLSQYLLYRALLRDSPELIPFGEDDLKTFDWRSEAESHENFEHSLRASEGFVAQQLASLHDRLELN